MQEDYIRQAYKKQEQPIDYNILFKTQKEETDRREKKDIDLENRLEHLKRQFPEKSLKELSGKDYTAAILIKQSPKSSRLFRNTLDYLKKKGMYFTQDGDTASISYGTIILKDESKR